MSNPTPLPTKDQVTNEIRQLATTLSNDMQAAALAKARELGFDLNRGRLSLEETLINLSSSRDVLLDAASKRKLSQLPLKIQYTLWVHVQKLSEFLTSLVNGTDAVLNLEEAVDDLLASIWQYNLHNLSEQVLGFQEKMNQLKSQEKTILEAHRSAQQFQETAAEARQLLVALKESRNEALGHAKSAEESAKQITSALAKVQEQEQKISALSTGAEQHNSAAALHAAEARSAAADAQTIAEKLPSIQDDLRTMKEEATELIEMTKALSSSFEETSTQAIESFKDQGTLIKKDVETRTADLRSATEELSSELKSTVGQLVEQTSTARESAERSHIKELKDGLDAFGDEAKTLLQKFAADYKAAMGKQAEDFEGFRTTATNENARLVLELDGLETQIKDSIRRATGYSLFHSFQTRQEGLAKSKESWAKALAAVVALSVLLSIGFIIYIVAIKDFGPALYLKLSFSLPLIYAIWFCSVQYSRERRLEEEYAFKSSISISLEPYRELVEKLVIRDNPEEAAKYTAFIIQSITAVFTSPMERGFPLDGKDSSPIEGIVGSIKDLVTEVLKTKTR